MRVMILTDLEGISNVDTIKAVDESTEYYTDACNKLMDDINATVSGAFDAGADEVYVIDGHGCAHNFVEGKLDPRAVQLSPYELTGSMTYEGFDAFLTIGCHAKAGTEKAFLDHTQSSAAWFDYTVGGKSYGEIGQQAICFGSYDKPIVMVSGDKAACDEAKSLIPNIAAACVKTANERNVAECIPHEEALKLIYDAAYDGVKRINEIKPYKISLPTEVALTLYRSDYCDNEHKRCPSFKREGRTLKKTVNEIIHFTDILLK